MIWGDDSGHRAAHQKRIETCDDEFVGAAKDFMNRQNKAGKPWFVWPNTTHMHLFTHTKKTSLGQAGRSSVITVVNVTARGATARNINTVG